MTENGGRIFEQTIFYPFMHMSNYARGSVLLSNLTCDKHDSKEFSDVPDLDCIATVNEAEDEVTVFCVNRCQSEDYELDVKLLDLNGFRVVEHIEMAGFKPLDGNNFISAPVKPSNAELPKDSENIHIKPFSWNVIRLKK